MLRGHLTGRVAAVMRDRRSCGVTIRTDGVLFKGTAGRGLSGLSRRALLSMFTNIPRCAMDHRALARKIGTMSLATRVAPYFPDGNRVHGVARNNNISLGGRGLATFSCIVAATSLLGGGCLLIRHNGGGCFLLVTRWGRVGVYKVIEGALSLRHFQGGR